MPQLCTLMPPRGAAAAERAGGLRAVWGACNGCLFVGSPSPGGAEGRGRGRHPARGTRQSEPRAHLGSLSTRAGPNAPGRRGASSSAACRAGRGRSMPWVPPGSVCARFPPVPPLRPARLRLSAARPQLPAQIRCRRAGRARKHLFPTWGRWGGRACGTARPRRGLSPLPAAVTRPYSPWDRLSERSHSVFTRSAEKRVSTLSSRVVFFHRVRSGGWRVGGTLGAEAVAAPTDLGLPTAPGPPTHPEAPTDPARAGSGVAAEGPGRAGSGAGTAGGAGAGACGGSMISSSAGGDLPRAVTPHCDV